MYISREIINEILPPFVFKICKDLDIKGGEICFDLIESTCKECVSKIETTKDKRKYKISLYTHSFKSEKEILYAAAHELRHVWQYENRHAPTKKHTLETYNATYDFNVCEIDANRYASKCVYGEKHKINKKYNMYFSSEELDTYCIECIKAGIVPA